MIDNQLIVCGEPNVELGAVAVDRISLYKCGKGVLGRAVRSPETTVGNDFLGLDSAACSKEQGGSKKYFFLLFLDDKFFYLKHMFPILYLYSPKIKPIGIKRVSMEI